MSLSEKALQELARLGYTADAELRFWQDLWQSAGESLFWRYVQSEIETSARYEIWFPRLQSFAVECRQAVPIPAVESFSQIEAEQYRVLLSKMQEFAASGDRAILNHRPNRAVILSTTRVGMAAARQVFGECEAVLLQIEEESRWFSEVYPIDLEKP